MTSTEWEYYGVSNWFEIAAAATSSGTAGSTDWTYWGVSNWFYDAGAAATSSGASPVASGARLLITVNGLTYVQDPRR